MKVYGGAGGIGRVDVARQHRREESPEHVTHTSAGHARIACGIDVNPAVGLCDDGLMTFENDDAVAELRSLSRGIDTIGIDRSGIALEDSRQLAGMGSDDP